MSKEKKEIDVECHKKLAADLFNRTWDLLGKKNHTPEEDDEMVHAAHASRYHWGVLVAKKVGKAGPINLGRGDWQISRVYSVLKRPESAIFFAKRNLDCCEKNNIGDFDLAFAYEALARGYAAAGKKKEFKKYDNLAKEAGKEIKSKEDRNYFFKDLEDGEWNEMK